MKQLFALTAILLLAACQSGPPAPEPEGADGPIVLERDNVQRFRGTEMVELLKQLESANPSDWSRVRRHVHPAPERPDEWPPRDDEMSEAQRKWRSYLLWPEYIRELLHKDDWDTGENRQRLADFGRMYEVMYEFQTRRQSSSEQQESRYWKEFVETMLVYGEDGEDLLVSNMILSLTNPDERVVHRAQDILRRVGAPAIEPLCAAVWTTHRQLAFITPMEGEGYYKTVANPNFNKYIIETLVLIGRRSVPQAIYELENTLDDDGRSVGPAWRYRKHFVEVIGELGPTLVGEVREDAARTLVNEAERVVVEEYDNEALADGRYVVDEVASDDAQFVFHQYLIRALGQVGHPVGLPTIVELWESDEFHEVEALRAIRRITGDGGIRSLRAARELVERLEDDETDEEVD